MYIYNKITTGTCTCILYLTGSLVVVPFAGWLPLVMTASVELVPHSASLVAKNRYKMR